MLTEDCPVVLIEAPEVYAAYAPPLRLTSNSSTIVPDPPDPAVAVADTEVPLQTAPAVGVGVKVPAVGCAFTLHVTVL